LSSFRSAVLKPLRLRIIWLVVLFGFIGGVRETIKIIKISQQED